MERRCTFFQQSDFGLQKYWIVGDDESLSWEAAQTGSCNASSQAFGNISLAPNKGMPVGGRTWVHYFANTSPAMPAPTMTTSQCSTSDSIAICDSPGQWVWRRLKCKTWGLAIDKLCLFGEWIFCLTSGIWVLYRCWVLCDQWCVCHGRMTLMACLPDCVEEGERRRHSVRSVRWAPSALKMTRPRSATNAWAFGAWVYPSFASAYLLSLSDTPCVPPATIRASSTLAVMKHQFLVSVRIERWCSDADLTRVSDMTDTPSGVCPRASWTLASSTRYTWTCLRAALRKHVGRSGLPQAVSLRLVEYTAHIDGFALIASLDRLMTFWNALHHCHGRSNRLQCERALGDPGWKGFTCVQLHKHSTLWASRFVTLMLKPDVFAIDNAGISIMPGKTIACGVLARPRFFWIYHDDPDRFLFRIWLAVLRLSEWQTSASATVKIEPYRYCRS